MVCVLIILKQSLFHIFCVLNHVFPVSDGFARPASYGHKSVVRHDVRYISQSAAACQKQKQRIISNLASLMEPGKFIIKHTENLFPEKE